MSASAPGQPHQPREPDRPRRRLAARARPGRAGDPGMHRRSARPTCDLAGRQAPRPWRPWAAAWCATRPRRGSRVAASSACSTASTMRAGPGARRQPDPRPPHGPESHSNQFYKGVVDDRAHAVFAGKIIVHQDAQKTNAYQKNDNLLLSDDAEIDTKPELEIYADDVKCSHGATVATSTRSPVLSPLARPGARGGRERADLRLRRRGDRTLRRPDRAPAWSAKALSRPAGRLRP